MSGTLNCNTTHVTTNTDKHSQTDSTSVNSTADEDFQTLDRSSSFQTSTDSPYKMASNKHQKQQADISGLKFFNQGLNTSNETHANYTRKSIIVSPSWREIKNEVVTEEMATQDLSFSFESEIPTNNFGMVASPSLQKLSEILTSKVNNSKLAVPSLVEIAEDSEMETIFNGDNIIKRNQSVNTFYTSQTITSNETYQLSNNLSVVEQPDLIDLTSPPLASKSKFDPKYDTSTSDVYQHEEPLNFSESPEKLSNSSSKSSGYNYTDIYEHYSPQKNPSINDNHSSSPLEIQEYNNNRVSMLSEQLTLGNIKTPKFDNEFFEDEDADNDESVKEIGYNKDDDTTTSSFSFVASVRPPQQEVQTPNRRNNDLDSPFLHNAANRLSMRIVERGSPTKIESNFNFGLTPVLDINSPIFNENANTQNMASIQPQIQQPKSPLLIDVPVKEQPISNTQQYSSLIKPINQISPSINEFQTFNKAPQAQTQYQSQLHNNTSKPLPKVEQRLNDDKPKKSKLTFKGLFKREDNISDAKTQNSTRPKSFSFGNLDNSNKKVPVAEKKEKSKSFLSSWKRKSIFSSTTNLANDQELPKTPKTPTSPRKSRAISFGSIGKLTPKQLSPHKHSQSVPIANVNLTNDSKSQVSQVPPPLLASYHLDSTPVLDDNEFNYNFNSNIAAMPATLKEQQQHQSSPVFNQVPVLLRDTSLQKISTSSNDEFQESQSAVIGYSSPIANESVEKVVDLSNNDTTFTDSVSKEDSNDIHTSSVYDTADTEFFKPPPLQVNKPVTPPNIYVDQFANDQTPIGESPSTLCQHTPASLTVASFTASPNKFHIGDDLFPKHLNINEIESIVSLERSRSMRSIKSNRITGSIRSGGSVKKSIVQLMQEKNEDFDEMVLPDGSILVKSPSFPAQDNFSNISRTGSILKPQLPSSPLTINETNQDMVLEQELSDLIDMINFDKDDDNDFLDTNFNIDTNFTTNFSPPRKVVSPEKQANTPKSYSPLRHSFEPPRKLGGVLERESSVPDFLGIDTDYYEYEDDFEVFEAFKSPVTSKVAFNKYDTPVEYIAPKQRQVSKESVEDIIRVEENYTQPQLKMEQSEENEPIEYHADAFIPDSHANRISMSFKGLKGPSLNNSLKTSTQDAIMGSINQLNSEIVPSDSENSLFQNIYNHGTNTDAYHKDFANEYQHPKLEPPPTFKPILAPALATQSEQQSNSKRYSITNPFYDYSQSYEDLPRSNNGSPIEKSKRFMQRLSNNDFAHLSTASLPATTKPKKLNKKRNKSSASFGKLFGTKEEKFKVQFSSRILLYETYGEDEYDREPDVATCNSLTPKLATEIKAELNELKSTMPIHEDSKCYTHFF